MKDAEWTVASVIDERHFTVTNSTLYTKTESNIGVTIYPLEHSALEPLGQRRHPGRRVQHGQHQQRTDRPERRWIRPPCSTSSIRITSTPGTLSASSITTPEFQLTTDTNIITLANTINSTILSSGNANGLVNFKSGSINMDLSAYLGSPYVSVSTVSTTKNGTAVTAVTTTTVDATALVNKLGDVLAGGMLKRSRPRTRSPRLINNATYFPPTQTATGHHHCAARRADAADDQRARQGAGRGPANPRLARVRRPTLETPHSRPMESELPFVPALAARLHPAGALRRGRHGGHHQHDPRPALHQRRGGAIGVHHHRLQGAGLHLPQRGQRFQQSLYPDHRVGVRELRGHPHARSSPSPTPTAAARPRLRSTT